MIHSNEVAGHCRWEDSSYGFVAHSRQTQNPHQRSGKDASEWDIEEYKENDFLKDDGYKNKFKGKKVFEAYYAAKN